ncbi:MAG: tetratricopeptide repeat protein [Gammaproteobacteria bacterium]|nr:tetratricopeptide repeat protein [Gammaproteobacteria bacterium]
MTMLNRYKFWTLMALFQIVFGLVIFAATRQYYVAESTSIQADPVAVQQPSLQNLNSDTKFSSTGINSATFNQLASNDPVKIEGQANELFSNGQYAEAAHLYEQLLSLDPGQVRTYNNLGITLQYLGKSSEALRNLNAGVAIDPTFQRIWLTLGYVNSQLGDSEQARKALTTAVSLDADSPIGQSAAKMLQELP